MVHQDFRYLNPRAIMRKGKMVMLSWQQFNLIVNLHCFTYEIVGVHYNITRHVNTRTNEVK